MSRVARGCLRPTPMSRGRKLGLLLLAGIAFGVLVAVVKGQDTGVRDALGNTSAPVGGRAVPRGEAPES